MKKAHKNLFKDLVSSYNDGTFTDKVESLLSEPNADKEALSKTISSLCGVKVDYSDNFHNNLKKAIKNHNPKQKIVEKIRNCNMECADELGMTSCQRSCPFDAIIYDSKTNTTSIDPKACTDCGFCVEGCPSGSILDKTDFLPLVELLKGDDPIIAAVAPAIAGQFNNASLEQLRSAFIKLGFTDMIEVAFFADMLTLKEAIEFDHFVKDKKDLMITSCCCPMWVGMLKQTYGELVKHVSPSVSPMIAAGRVMKKLSPKTKVVFIGPCIAKKAEIKQPDLIGDIDFVLTFSEVQEIFNTFHIKPEEMDATLTKEYAAREGRLYARTGGVSISVGEAVARLFPEKKELFSSVQANGVIECKNLLTKTKNGELENNFLEGMGCVGGCVGGPKSLISREEGTKHVNEVAEMAKVKIAMDNEVMKDILSKIGIDSIEDYKNHEKVSIFERKF